MAMNEADYLQSIHLNPQFVVLSGYFRQDIFFKNSSSYLDNNPSAPQSYHTRNVFHWSNTVSAVISLLQN